MTPSGRGATSFPFVLLCSVLTGCMQGGAAPRVQGSADALTVPETDGAPVLVDGVFTEGEWDDALVVDASEAVKLHLKQEKGHVFIGVRCIRLISPIVDLFIQPAGQEEVYQLHVSAQLGEIVLADEPAGDPPWVWGGTRGWYANEVRWDQSRRERLIAEGMDRNRAQVETLFPYDGFEFQILKSRFEGSAWRIRVEVPSAPEYDAPFVFPPRTDRRSAENWLLLNLGTS